MIKVKPLIWALPFLFLSALATGVVPTLMAHYSSPQAPLQWENRGESTPYEVNVNTATQADLEALPHIGPHRARGILKLRSRLGKIHHLEEIRQVRGIGEKTLGKIAPYLRF